MLIHLDFSRSRWWGHVTCKQFEPGQTRETGADLDPNHLTSVRGIKVWGPAYSLSSEVCSLSDLANIADQDQVLHYATPGRTL